MVAFLVRWFRLYIFVHVMRYTVLVRHRKALFLSRLSRREEAIESALLSIAGFPWNWSAWTLLGSCIGDGEEVCNFVAPLRNIISFYYHAVIFAPVAPPVTTDSSVGTNVPN